MKTLITDKLSRYFAVTPDEATEEQIYKSTVLAVKEILTAKRQRFKKKSVEQDQKEFITFAWNSLWAVHSN